LRLVSRNRTLPRGPAAPRSNPTSRPLPSFCAKACCLRLSWGRPTYTPVAAASMYAHALRQAGAQKPPRATYQVLCLHALAEVSHDQQVDARGRHGAEDVRDIGGVGRQRRLREPKGRGGRCEAAVAGDEQEADVCGGEQAWGWAGFGAALVWQTQRVAAATGCARPNAFVLLQCARRALACYGMLSRHRRPCSTCGCGLSNDF